MKQIPRPEYPRPQFIREHWMNLNGPWEFSFDEPCYDRTILVPFAFQSEMSGIGDTAAHDRVFYRRRFSLPTETENKRILLHFGAVDYACEVFVNGVSAVRHEGGHVSFETEITRLVRTGENELCVWVTDRTRDLEMPRGKQYWKEKSEGIFYTRTTGIWQTVWLEAVGRSHIRSVLFTPDLDDKSVDLEYELELEDEADLTVTVKKDGIAVAEAVVRDCARQGRLRLALDQRRLDVWNFAECLAWSPEHPNLFDVELELCPRTGERDRVRSYFGMRKVSVENGMFCLNNRRYTQKLVLDQGYWPQSLMTAPSEEAFVRDIELCRQMGFNGVRKHQKIEDPVFLYHADRLGLLVWEEMPSAYLFSRRSVRRVASEWTQAVLRDYSHPCIVVWTPLNESWGVENIKDDAREQSHSAALVALTKSLDATRPVVSNDGWEHTCTDLLTIHDYSCDRCVLEKRYASLEKTLASLPARRPLFASGWRYDGQPVLVTEYGGISYQTGKTAGWGYSQAESDEDFARRFADCTEPLLGSPVVEGYCYTQLTDVEQEINGLLTPDRHPKMPTERIRAVYEGKRTID